MVNIFYAANKYMHACTKLNAFNRAVNYTLVVWLNLVSSILTNTEKPVAYNSLSEINLTNLYLKLK